MIAFTIVIIIEVRLLPGDDKTSLINIRISIRDMFDCVTQFDIDSIIIVSHLMIINKLIDIFQESNNESIKEQ
jgi:hypothetical protein